MKKRVQDQALTLQKKRCDQCLFSQAKVVSDERRDQIIEDCLKRDHFFVCHKGSIKGLNIVCRGFWDKHKTDVWPLRLAVLVGGLPEVEEKGDRHDL